MRHVANLLVIKEELRNHPNPPPIIYVDLLGDVRTPAGFYRVVTDAVCRALPATSPPDKLDDFRQFKSFIAALGSHLLPVVLLDELDALANRPEFDSTFWLSLRSLGQAHVVWITASCLHIQEFTRTPGEMTSPFFNAFHVTPLIIGSLSDDEVAALIVPPAEGRGVHLGPEDVQGIRRLAGGLPYLLQVAAEAWFFARTDGVTPDCCFETVMCELLDPRTLMPDIFSSYWRHLTLREQQCLERAALRKVVPQTSEYQDAQKMLLDFGLLAKQDGVMQPSGELLRGWLISETDKKGQSGVFIGHGHNHLWRALRDFVEKTLHLRVVCYDAEPREGQSIVNILDDMLNQSEYAAIVLTGEDTMAGGQKRARQNVVHEAGYCQGKLGFERVVLLKQKGAESLSNLDGLQYIEFEGERIQDAFPALFAFFMG